MLYTLTHLGAGIVTDRDALSVVLRSFDHAFTVLVGPREGGREGGREAGVVPPDRSDQSLTDIRTVGGWSQGNVRRRPRRARRTRPPLTSPSTSPSPLGLPSVANPVVSSAAHGEDTDLVRDLRCSPVRLLSSSRSATASWDSVSLLESNYSLLVFGLPLCSASSASAGRCCSVPPKLPPRLPPSSRSCLLGARWLHACAWCSRPARSFSPPPSSLSLI